MSCPTPVFVVVCVFALTMADDADAGADQLKDMKTQVDGLAMDIMTMHEWLDSTVAMTNARFDQLDLTQTTTKTTLDEILSSLDALNTWIIDSQWDYGGDTELDDGDRRGRARLILHHPCFCRQFCFVFALTMADNTDVGADPLTDMKTQFKDMKT